MTSDRWDVLWRYFAGLTEQTFEGELGIVDPPLVDYVSGLLTRFIRTETVYRMRNPSGNRLSGVADMLTEANARVGEARREAHRFIGDFTLFWTGVYPEALGALQSETRKDHLLDYRAEGKRAYHVASQIPANEEIVAGDVLERLSTQYELCMYGLGEVRREWEKSGDGDAGLICLDS
ncbi:MAG: hypothetical protein WD875_13175 [Pirellulales bacterium]